VPKLIVIGLVGGIGSGKSHLAKLLAKRGAEIIDADRLGHAVLARPDIAQRVGETFGPSVLDSQGSVVRSQLAKMLFGADSDSKRRLSQLEAILHPEIHELVEQRLRQIGGSPSASKLVVIDAPLLLEAGWADLCDAILFVDTPLAIRRQRCLERGWSLKHFTEREQSQLSLDEKRQRATQSVDGAAEQSTQLATLDRLLGELSGVHLPR
jgi:dephospho-CoA kinase